MPTARLRIQIPEGVWVSDVSTSHPDVRFRVLTAQVADDRGVGVVEVAGAKDDVEDAVEDAREHPTLSDVEVLEDSEDSTLMQFETQVPLLMTASNESGAPFETPFEISEGEGVWDVTSARSSLSDLGRRLDDIGVEYEVEHVRMVEEDSLLTDRQRDLVERAIREGYYDTPREATLSEVAEAAGLAKSTTSETLHRAEGKIVKDYFGA